MSGRYERVNAQDDDDSIASAQHPTIPTSPPPSFHSRSSSLGSRDNIVDSTLADAFDSDGDDSDNDADDTQRLVGRTSMTPTSDTPPLPAAIGAPTLSTRNVTELPRAAGVGAGAGAGLRTYGGGSQSDGVFSNLSAKPETGEVKDEQPPTYEQAAADAAPPYWETTILAPGLGGPDEVYIDGMPVGSFFSFVWNGMISMSFQLVGFLLTYLLHSTHAAKNGSRAGLGITLIQYGFYMRGTDDGGDPMNGRRSAMDGYANPSDPNSHNFDPGAVGTGGGESGGDGSSGGLSDLASSAWVAYVLMTVGWFILIRAISDYLKARRHEQLVLQSPDRGLGVPIIAEGENPEHVV